MVSNIRYTFAVIALGHLGDTLLVEPMCKNIKNNFPNSKIIFIANDLFKDIPMGFDSVDRVIGYDKQKEHKGIIGYLKFYMHYMNTEKIDYAIITHPHERSILVAKLLRAKNIISLPVKRSLLNCLINKKRKLNKYELRNTFKADYNSQYLSDLCKCKIYPVSYYRPDINTFSALKKFNLPYNYTVLSPTSKQLVKDWDYQNIKSFIIQNKYVTVLVGTDKANKIARQLKEDNVSFIDLTNKTTICELGAIIKSANTCVSVDTGTFHLSYAQNVKTIGLFFNHRMTKEWVPNNLNNIKLLQGKKYEKNHNIICEKSITAEDVLKEIRNFDNGKDKCLSVLR